MPDAVAPDGSDIHFRVRDAKRASLVEVVLAPGRSTSAPWPGDDEAVLVGDGGLREPLL